MYKCVLLSLLFLALTFSQNLLAEEKITFIYESNKYGRLIKSALDNNELEKAKELIDEAREKFPDSSRILHFAARYELKQNFVSDDSVVGGYTSSDGVQKVVALIEQAREKPDFDGAPLSLLVHLYARNGEVEKAYAALAEFKKLGARDPWIVINTALIYIAESKFQEAYDLLSDNVLNRKLRDSTVYGAAWYFLRLIRNYHPQFEVNKAVKSGLMERVAAEELIDYIDSYKGGEPLFILISSDDINCPYCVTNNELYLKLADNEKNNYKFVLATVEPWNKIGSYPDIYEFFPIAGVPFSSIVQNGEMLDYFAGSFPDYLSAAYMSTINSERVKNGGGGRFLDKPTGKASVLRSVLFLRWLVYVSGLKYKYKSLAIAIAMTDDNSFYASSQGVSNDTQDAANNSAKKLCEEAKKKRYRGKYDSCQVIMEGSELKAEYFDDETLKVLTRDMVLIESLMKKSDLKKIDKAHLSAHNGDAESQYFLAWAYKKGAVVKQDLAIAISWFKKAAENGHANAQKDLGWAYKRGDGVEKNEKKAIYWFQKASDQGHVQAAVSLGWIYATSGVVEKDYVKALSLFDMAAKKNHLGAWSYLGYMYENGFGVEKNYRTALEMYRRNPKPLKWAKQRAQEVTAKLDRKKIN